MCIHVCCVCVCLRVFSDRLVDSSDAEAFVGLMAEKLGSLFDLTYPSICPNKIPPVFGTETTAAAEHINTISTSNKTQESLPNRHIH